MGEYMLMQRNNEAMPVKTELPSPASTEPRPFIFNASYRRESASDIHEILNCNGNQENSSLAGTYR